MHLTTEDKLRIFISDASAFIGILFSGGGLLFASLTLNMTDFSSLPMACVQLEETMGKVITALPTNVSVNDSTVIEYTYQYRSGGHLYTAHSFSELAHLPGGSPVTVEYLPGQPSFARIRGMSNAALPLWSLLLLLVFVFIGAGILYLNWRRMRRMMALAANPFVTQGICHRIEDLDKKDDEGRKTYRSHYQYSVGGQFYTHSLTLNSTETAEYGVEEPLVAQLDQPRHAYLARDLPDFIWQRLRRQRRR